MKRLALAVAVTVLSLVIVSSADNAPEKKEPITCEPGVPMGSDGTCGLTWDDIREQPVYK